MVSVDNFSRVLAPVWSTIGVISQRLYSCYTYRCVNYGVLPPKEAAKLNAIVAERKKKQRVGGMPASSSSSAPKKKKAKIVKEEAVDTELQLPGAEGIASANL